MRRKDLKMYFNRYNGKPRLFIGSSYNFIYLRGGLGYVFWRKWSNIIKPCSLYDLRVLWNLDVNSGCHLPQTKDCNSYGRRLYQRHVSSYYVERDFDLFGLVPQANILLFEHWSFKEHKEHCLGINRMRRFMPLSKDSVLFPTVCYEVMPF